MWTAAEILMLKREYPDRPTIEIARRLKCCIGRVYRQAWLLGLRKSKAFLAGPYNGRLHKGHAERGAAYRFKKGHAPANKGLRRPGWAPGRMRETQFKKGIVPVNLLPIGATVVNGDGYLVRKVKATGLQRERWLPVHREIWVRAHGSVPFNHVVAFKPGRKTTNLEETTLDGIELITRTELAKRNRMWNIYPRELARAIQLRGALKRRINTLERRAGEKQDR